MGIFLLEKQIVIFYSLICIVHSFEMDDAVLEPTLYEPRALLA